MLKNTLALSILAFSLSAERTKYHETLYTDWGQSFTTTEELFRQKTDFQDLLIFQNPFFGRVLALDGVIQTTELDEPIYTERDSKFGFGRVQSLGVRRSQTEPYPQYDPRLGSSNPESFQSRPKPNFESCLVYHEMMVHVPLLAHDNPKSVLIIGGDDGGSLREVLKHPNIERAVVVDIDQAVIDLSKQYLPKLSGSAFDHPKARIVIQDAALFVKECKEMFDIIICDSTDPIGPGAALFTSEFYGDCKKLLNKNGIFINQNGVPFMQQTELAMTLWNNRKPHFKHVTFYLAPVTTYAGGHMAFGWASDRKYRVSEAVLAERLSKLKGELFYYTPEVHKASFALPNFMKKQIGSILF